MDHMTSVCPCRLGLYHHLLVGQAGKSFLWKDAKSGTLWLWVRSQAAAESFPFFQRRRCAARRARPHPPPSSWSSPLPSVPLQILSLSRLRLSALLMLLAFSGFFLVFSPRPC